MDKIDIINGPNINVLEKRPDPYNKTSLEHIEYECRSFALEHAMNVSFHQSNSEGELVTWIQQSSASGIIINPAAYTHYSFAILEALHCFKGPIIEVHITNILSSGSSRSVTVAAAEGMICGFGLQSYIAALSVIKHLINSRS